MKGILCDIGGVLAHSKGTYRRIADAMSIESKTVKKEIRPILLKAQVDAITPQEFFMRCAERLSTTQEMIRAACCNERISYDGELIDLIRPYDVVLISNSTRWSGGRIPGLTWPTLLSFEERRRKPNPRMLYKGASLLQRTPENYVFIDNQETYVLAASALGMDCILYTGKRSLEYELSKRGFL